jgi:hypothetical protein
MAPSPQNPTSYEGHGDFQEPWKYIITFMGNNNSESSSSKANWYSDAALINVKLAKRGVETKSGKSPFSFMDGATHMTYQYTHRVEEDLYCEQTPKPASCRRVQPRGFDPDTPNIPL